ncbi:MAG TPA: transcriptional repressor [Phycisphaerales bacterium]|nr:transcriptional repressor [Phycisphaerales bacterium]
MPPKRQAVAEPPIEIAQPLCAVFRRYLKSIGQKYTPERAQVLDALFEFDGVFQAEQLLARLRREDTGGRVSKATVYRTIKLLQGAGILQQVLFDAEHAHYQLVYGRRPLDLLIDLESNRVIPIDVPELAAIRERVCKQHGLSPRGHRFQIFAAKGE